MSLWRRPSFEELYPRGQPAFDQWSVIGFLCVYVPIAGLVLGLLWLLPVPIRWIGSAVFLAVSLVLFVRVILWGMRRNRERDH